MDDPNAARRFFNEAKAISMVSHPSLVKIFEYGNCPTDDGSEGEAYIVMEYLDGETLRARLAKRYLGQTCRATDAPAGLWTLCDAQAAYRPSRPQAGQHHAGR